MTERFKENKTSLDVYLDTSGLVFYPQLYTFADADALPLPGGGTTTVRVPPICRLSVTPLVQGKNLDLSWDISNSEARGGAALEYYSISWGAATNTGAIVNAAWSGAKTGTIQYTTKGRKTITASVKDDNGRRSPACKVQVEIIGDVNDPTDGVTADVYDRLYIGTTDAGCFVMTPTSVPVASNTGLSGDHLKFRSMRVNPVTRTRDHHHLIAATAGGLAISVNSASSWVVFSKADLGEPANDASDNPAPVTGDLDQIDVWFDPLSQHRIYLLRTTATRAWLYLSEDYGVSWSNKQIGAETSSVTTASFTFDTDEEGFDLLATMFWTNGDGSPDPGCLETSYPIYNTQISYSWTAPYPDVSTGDSASCLYRVIANTAEPYLSNIVDVTIIVYDTSEPQVELANITAPVTITAAPYDSGWLTLDGDFHTSGSVGSLFITSQARDIDTGATYDIFIDTVSIAGSANPYNLTHSQGGLPGSIKE